MFQGKIITILNSTVCTTFPALIRTCKLNNENIEILTKKFFEKIKIINTKLVYSAEWNCFCTKM